MRVYNHQVGRLGVVSVRPDRIISVLCAGLMLAVGSVRPMLVLSAIMP